MLYIFHYFHILSGQYSIFNVRSSAPNSTTVLIPEREHRGYKNAPMKDAISFARENIRSLRLMMYIAIVSYKYYVTLHPRLVQIPSTDDADRGL